MKIYRGFNSKRPGPQSVNVEFDDSRETYVLPPRNDVWNHSPDGFSWGYGGSGPAQLALAIMLDHLGDENKAIALSLYQKFKWEVIAKLDQTAPWWIIDQAAIDAWLVGKGIER